MKYIVIYHKIGDSSLYGYQEWDEPEQAIKYADTLKARGYATTIIHGTMFRHE